MSNSILRVIARPIPWPGLREKPDRAGLRLRWDARREAGDLLAEATERPLADGALVLLDRGAAPDALVTMRHEGAPHDTFPPVPLQVAAADALRRRAVAQTLRGNPTSPARTPDRTPADGEGPLGPCARPVAHVGAGSGDTR